MSQEIKMNGQRYANGGYGTYTRIVEPPIDAGTTYTIDAQWGSRLAIMSGFLKGFGAMGSALIAGIFTYQVIGVASTIVFPRPFEFIPMIRIRSIGTFNKNYFDSKRQPEYITGFFDRAQQGVMYQSSAIFYADAITETGFKLIWSSYLSTVGNTPKRPFWEPVSWQAFGI